ncbi:hypothetical protein [Methanoculleus sp. UBA303]|jgi:hypothetical protein|uniref:hypothetical protein n=1 Tax=Methanoculleus sp. UBA303 TaxID=1915497 RepID=UPI0025EB9B15|nr:hypothetical protein [Methanoculleus sp. UBA303]
MKKEEHRAGEEGYRVRREENRELERREQEVGREGYGMKRTQDSGTHYPGEPDHISPGHQVAPLMDERIVSWMRSVIPAGSPLPPSRISLLPPPNPVSYRSGSLSTIPNDLRSISQGSGAPPLRRVDHPFQPRRTSGVPVETKGSGIELLQPGDTKK